MFWVIGILVATAVSVGRCYEHFVAPFLFSIWSWALWVCSTYVRVLDIHLNYYSTRDYSIYIQSRLSLIRSFIFELGVWKCSRHLLGSCHLPEE